MLDLVPGAAAFEKRLAGLPVIKHPARRVVLGAGSKTGRLFFLRNGAVQVIKDGVQIANVSAPGSVFGEQEPDAAPIEAAPAPPVKAVAAVPTPVNVVPLRSVRDHVTAPTR